MNRTKTKLRLRKQVLISFPIAIIVSVLAVVYILSQNTMVAQEVEKDDSLMSTVVSTNKDTEVYNLNTDKAVEIARKLTNDYTSESYKKTYIIAPSNYKPKTGNITSEEAGIIFFVKDLFTYPQSYGVAPEEIRLSMVPRTTRRYNAKGELIMNNGMTFEQYVGKIADLFGVDKTTVLAISYHEAGVKTSNLFQNKNNIGGHKGLNGWKSFMTLEAGVIGHVLSIRNISTKHGIDLSTEQGLSDFSSVYVNGHLGAPSAHWIEKVSFFKNKITKEDLFKVE